MAEEEMEQKEMSEIVKSVLLRFIRAFVAGAVSVMITVVPMASGSGWKDLSTWLSALALGAIVGGISGIIQSTDKYLRS